MATTTLLSRASVAVIDYRCEARQGDEPYAEWHDAFSISYVRAGSFGYRYRGEAFELVAGSFLVGHPGDEYMCTHDHVGGDECLSFYFDPSLVDAIGGGTAPWRAGSLPPSAGMMVLGELGQAAASGRSALGLDEVGMHDRGAHGRCRVGTHSADRSNCPHATAGAPSRPLSGWKPIPTSRSASTKRRARPA